MNMKYFAVAALAAVVQSVDVTQAQPLGFGQIKSQTASQVKANLNENYFTQLLQQKTHVCAHTAIMNKDTTQPKFSTLYDELSESDPWTDTAFPADENALIWADAGEEWDTASDVDVWKRI